MNFSNFFARIPPAEKYTQNFKYFFILFESLRLAVSKLSLIMIDKIILFKIYKESENFLFFENAGKRLSRSTLLNDHDHLDRNYVPVHYL